MSRFIFFTLFVFFFARMFKCNRYSQNAISKLVIWCLFLTLFSACSDSFSNEIKHVDKLNAILTENEPNLELDEKLFTSRITYIDGVLRTFKNEYTDTISLELGNSLSRIKAIKKVYIKQMGNYTACVQEQKVLVLQLINLKNDLKSNTITKEEFKSYYSTEEADIQKHISTSKYLSKSLYEVEPEFIRLSKTLVSILDTIETSPK